MEIQEITGLTSKQIDIYFNYQDRISGFKKTRFWGVLITIAGLSCFAPGDLQAVAVGLTAFGLILFFIGRTGIKNINNLCPEDTEIDKAWDKLAESREDEAYRASNYKKKDTIRDSDYIFVYPSEIPVSSSKNPRYTYTMVHSPNDHIMRRNYLDVVRLIYGEDQIMTFRETLSLTDGWDGLDETKEYYWTDVAGITMDQKENEFQILVGGQNIAYPLTGEKDRGNQDERESLKNYIEKAEKVSNALRSLLRSKKKS